MSGALICLPLGWPDPDLARTDSPGRKARAIKTARETAYKRLRKVAPLLKIPPDAALCIEFVFIPPNLRRLAVPKLAARMAATCAGFADYLECDDAAFLVSFRLSKAPTPGGQVFAKLQLVQCIQPAQENAI